MRFSVPTAIGALATAANAQNILGFNSGSTDDTGAAKFKADFVQEFNTAKNLVGAPGDFTAFRLYTNIQSYSDNAPIEAFEAAIETDTKLLLGVWASGTDSIDNEIAALQTALSTYGSKLADLVIGISIGSEDLYRDSATGMENDAGIGNSPEAILGFMNDFKTAFKGSALANIPVGHVDTWDVWPNSSVSAVVEACDFLGVNEFPYYETGEGNSIDNAINLFDRAYETVQSVAGGKPVWVTETGWPYVGPDWDEAESSVANAKQYWDEVGCGRLFGQTTAFWYTLRDANPENTMKFAITDNLSTKARFDLSCPDNAGETSSTKTSSATKTSSTGGSSATSTATSTGNGDGETTATATSDSTTGSSTSGETTPTSTTDSDETMTTSGSSSEFVTTSGSMTITMTDNTTTEPTGTTTTGGNGDSAPTPTTSGDADSASSTPSQTPGTGAGAALGVSGVHVALAAAGVAAYIL